MSQSKRRNGFKMQTIGEATPKLATSRQEFKTQTEISSQTLTKCPSTKSRSTKSRQKQFFDKFQRRRAKCRQPSKIRTQINQFRQNRQVEDYSNNNEKQL